MEPPEQKPEQPDLLQQRPTMFQPVTVGELEQQCQDLKTLLTATFVALLVLSASVNLFLAKQMRQVRAKVAESRPVIKRMEAEFRSKEPNMKNFLNALQSFAASNRDFQPVLDRYRAALPQYLAAPVGINAGSQGITVPLRPITNAPATQPAGR